MALKDFRFRKTDASVSLDWINDRLPSSASVVDQAGGQVATVNFEESAEADLVDVMAELGFSLIEGTGGAGVTGTSYDDNEQRRDLIKSPVRVRENSDLITASWAPTGAGKNKTLTSPGNALSYNDFDGVTFTAGVLQRVLLTGIGAHNGIYFLEQAADGVSNPAILKRAYDADEDAEVKSGMQCLIVEGSSELKIFAIKTLDPIGVDATALVFGAIRDENDATHNMLFGAGSVGSSTTTRYLFPAYSDSIAQTSVVQFRSSRAGTMKNMRVRHNKAAGNGNSIVYTVRINGTPSSLSVSMASTANDGSDLVNTAAVAAGDLVDVEITKASAVGQAPSDVAASVEFD
jgi:hypothetical protein